MGMMTAFCVCVWYGVSESFHTKDNDWFDTLTCHGLGIVSLVCDYINLALCINESWKFGIVDVCQWKQNLFCDHFIRGKLQQPIRSWIVKNEFVW